MLYLLSLNSTERKAGNELPGLSSLSGTTRAGKDENVNKNQIIETVWGIAAPIAETIGVANWFLIAGVCITVISIAGIQLHRKLESNQR